MPIKQSNKGIDTRSYIVKKNIHVGILGKIEEDGGSQFIYALWKKVKPKLEKLGFKIKETVIDNPNYDKEIEKLSRNKYDMLIGYISILSRRGKLANYTRPIVLDQQIIVYKPKKEINSYFYHILELILPVVIIFISFGFLLSSILYFFGNHYKTKKHKIKWHLWGTFGAILGEPGSIVEKVDITKRVNIFIAFLILLFMFFFSLILEATLTQQTYQKSIDSQKDPIGVNIKNDKYIVGKGTSMVDTIKKAGAFAEEKTVKTQEIQDIYLKNTDKNIKGFVTDLSTWGGIISKKKKYSKLVKSAYQFSFDDIAWMVNRNEHVLLESVEIILSDFRSQHITQKLCFEKMPWMNIINCSI
jgi:hypothetical protein